MTVFASELGYRRSITWRWWEVVQQLQQLPMITAPPCARVYTRCLLGTKAAAAAPGVLLTPGATDSANCACVRAAVWVSVICHVKLAQQLHIVFGVNVRHI